MSRNVTRAVEHRRDRNADPIQFEVAVGTVGAWLNVDAVAYELFDDLLDRSQRIPHTLRGRLVLIPLFWLLITAVLLVTRPVVRNDAGSVARAAVLALVSALWLWGWSEILHRARIWLRGHPQLGDLQRVAAYLAVTAAYPALTLAGLFVAFR